MCILVSMWSCLHVFVCVCECFYKSRISICENMFRCLCLGMNQRDKGWLNERGRRLWDYCTSKMVVARSPSLWSVEDVVFTSSTLFASVSVCPPRSRERVHLCVAAPLEARCLNLPTRVSGSSSRRPERRGEFQRLAQGGDVGRPIGLDLGSAGLGSEKGTKQLRAAIM